MSFTSDEMNVSLLNKSTNFFIYPTDINIVYDQKMVCSPQC